MQDHSRKAVLNDPYEHECAPLPNFPDRKPISIPARTSIPFCAQAYLSTIKRTNDTNEKFTGEG